MTTGIRTTVGLAFASALLLSLGAAGSPGYAGGKRADYPPDEKKPKGHREQVWNQYAVKHVCGRPQPPGQVLNDGLYFTAVNVHNPELERSVSFLWKVAVALPRLEEGPISEFHEQTLGADGALEIDCPTIFEVSESQRFSKGYVVLLTKDELDVVAVYTAGAAPNQQVVTLNTERVEPRQVVGNPRGVEATPATACVGVNCCCNSPASLSNPSQRWGDCVDPATECRALRPGGVFHPGVGARIDVNVCMPRNQPLYVPAVHSSQPAYCRYP